MNAPALDRDGEPLECHVRVDAAASGAWNMAVDEVALESAAESGVCSLRFYRWSEPTLSLGYFQNFADRSSHAPSAKCPVVRRASGGGAILHDREITYSLTMPLAPRAVKTASWLYDIVHGSLIAALTLWKIQADRCEPAASTNELGPFMCFQRRACGDVLVDGQKVCGSAQRRRGSAILQHGSLLVAASKSAPELPGLIEVSKAKFDESELLAAWLAMLAERMNLALAPTPMTGRESDRAAELVEEKYGNSKWTQRR